MSRSLYEKQLDWCKEGENVGAKRRFPATGSSHDTYSDSPCRICSHDLGKSENPRRRFM